MANLRLRVNVCHLHLGGSKQCGFKVERKKHVRMRLWRFFPSPHFPNIAKFSRKLYSRRQKRKFFTSKAILKKFLSQICHWIFLEILCFSNMRISSIVFKLFIFYYLTSRRSIGKVTPTWPIRRTRQLPWRRCLRFRKLHQRFPRCWKPWIA